MLAREWLHANHKRLVTVKFGPESSIHTVDRKGQKLRTFNLKSVDGITVEKTSVGSQLNTLLRHYIVYCSKRVLSSHVCFSVHMLRHAMPSHPISTIGVQYTKAFVCVATSTKWPWFGVGIWIDIIAKEIPQKIGRFFVAAQKRYESNWAELRNYVTKCRDKRTTPKAIGIFLPWSIRVNIWFAVW